MTTVERKKELWAAWYAKPENRAKIYARRRQRYAEDPTYREASRAHAKEYAAKARSTPNGLEHAREKSRLRAQRATQRVRDDFSLWARRKTKEARVRAKKCGVPFDLCPEDFAQIETCPVTLKRMIYGASSALCPEAASLDRLVPEKGYVRGNVRVISLEANLLKRRCTDPAVFRRLADYVEGAST